MKSKQKISSFFTFCGTAEEAMNYYLTIFPDSQVLSIKHTNEEGEGNKKVLVAVFELMGQPFMVMDMEEKYCPEHSWATSQYVDCDTEEEFQSLFSKLSDNGTVMMGPEPVLQLRLVAWVTDKFGVTWQLVWE